MQAETISTLFGKKPELIVVVEKRKREEKGTSSEVQRSTEYTVYDFN
jgi:hypothetical protein